MVHLDADAFFASVEQAADRRLRRLPVAVGGQRRGIVASASYEARAFGISTAMPTQRALQLCPDLRVVPGNFELYEEFSGNIFDLCESISPLVERTSIDEGYLSLDGWPGRRTAGSTDSAERQRVQRIQQLNEEVQGWMKITLSTGIASNKLVSQVASKLRKPHGFVVVPPGAEEAFLRSLPLRRLPGIGPKTAESLAGIGLQRIGDLVQAGADHLRPFFKGDTEALLERARGVDPTPLSLEKEAAKSYGQQRTFAEDIGDFETLVEIIQTMIDEGLQRVRADKKQARTMTLRIRYNDMQDASHARSLEEPSDLEDSFYGKVRPMLRHLWTRRVHLRLVGVTFSNIYDVWVQPDLFQQRYQQRRELAHLVDELNENYGYGKRPVLRRACHLVREKGP